MITSDNYNLTILSNWFVIQPSVSLQAFRDHMQSHKNHEWKTFKRAQLGAGQWGSCQALYDKQGVMMDYANWYFLKYRRSLLRLLNAMALNSVRLYLQRRHLVCQKINHCNTVGCHVCQGSPTILSLILRSPRGVRQASSSIVAVVLV